MKKKALYWLVWSMLLCSGCGKKEPIVIPKPQNIPDMEEIVESLEPEEEKGEETFSDEAAQVYITRGTYVLTDINITDDDSVDKIEVICYGNSEDYEGYAKGWDIIINDELAYDLYSPDYMQPEISFYMVDDKCIYLTIKEYAPENSDLKGFKLYEYKNEKLKPVCDFYEYVTGTTYEDCFYADIVYAKANQIVLYCYSQFDTEGYPHWNVTYNLEGTWIAENVDGLPLVDVQPQ